MSKAEPAIIVDREGLARQVANRPLSFILYELLQTPAERSKLQPPGVVES